MTGLILYRTIGLTIGVIAVTILLMYAYSWYTINFKLPKMLTEFGKEHDDFDIKKYEPFQEILSHLKKGNDHVLSDGVIKEVISAFDEVNKNLVIANRTYKYMPFTFKLLARKCINPNNLYDKYTVFLKFMIRDAEVLSEIISMQNEHFEWLKNQPNDTELCVLNH